MKKKFFKITTMVVVIYIFMVSPGLADTAQDPSSSEMVKAVVEEYCWGEFIGLENMRVKLVKYSPQRKAIIEKTIGPLEVARIMFWQAVPLFVVTSFDVQNIIIEGDTAVATISFRQVVKTEGEGVMNRRLIPDYKQNDIEKLHLKYDGKQWWIIDPPLPRISKEALIKYFERIIARREGSPRITDRQKEHYQYYVNELNELKNLQDKPKE